MSIRQLVDNHYDLYNVSKKKAPIMKDKKGMRGWEKLTYEELVKQHDYGWNLWGLRLGQQTNGKHILSLDFDVCGKPSKEDGGKRNGCPETQAFLDEYRAKIDRFDGMFSSSTVGNMNVLVDYSVSSQIQEWVAALGKAKFSVFELEILVAKNQIIPPSATTSKLTLSVGPARKFLTAEPFYVMESEDGFMFEFLKRMFDTGKQKSGTSKARREPQPPKNPKNNTAESPRNSTITLDAMTNMTDIYLILLFQYIKNEYVKNEKTGNLEKQISWDQWFQIGGILKYNNYDYSVWEQYNNLIEIKNATDNYRKIWDSIKNTPMSIYGLQNICKEVNEHGYKDWKIKYKKYLSLKVLRRGENDVAKYIAPYLHDKLVFCNDRWIIFDKRTGLWRYIKEPTSTVVSAIHNQIDEARESILYVKNKTESTEEKEQLAKRESEYMTYYASIAKGGYSSTLKKYLSEGLYDSEFEQKLDNNKYKVAFKNGIMDLKTGEFRHGLLPEDYITKTVPFNYEKALEADKALVRKELKKICNNNEEHLNYYLSTFGYAISGDSSKLQNFWFLRGQKASNGKSVLFEALTGILPNYVIQIDSDIFESTYGSRHKEMASWGGVRLGWVNEVSKKKQDVEFMKKLADGTPQPYKVMYGCMSVMPISFKLFFVSNHTLSFDADNGFNRRLIMEQLDSDFVDDLEEDDEANCRFVKDRSFGEKLQTTYKHALLDLIFDYAKAFVDDGYNLKPYPNDWKEETKETIGSNSDFPTWFEDNFVIGEGLQASKKMVEDRLSSYTFAHKGVVLKLKDELKRMGVKYKYDSQERCCGEKTKGIYTGFTIKVIEVIEVAKTESLESDFRHYYSSE
jgi:hypothetical protein